MEDDLQEANVFPNFMLSLNSFRDANVEACKKYPREQSIATAHDHLTTNIVLSNEHDYTYLGFIKVVIYQAQLTQKQ